MNTVQIQVKGESLLIKLRLKPGASSDEFNGVREGAIQISVKAPPVEGKANRHCARFLAKQLGLPGSSVSIARGEKSRDKWFRVHGMSEKELRTRLRTLLEVQPDD